MRRLASVLVVCAVAQTAPPLLAQAQSAQALLQAGKSHDVMGEAVEAQLVAYEKAAALGLAKAAHMAIQLTQTPCDGGVAEACELGGLTPAPSPTSAY